MATNSGSLTRNVFCLPAHSLVNTWMTVRAGGLLSMDSPLSLPPGLLAHAPLLRAGKSCRHSHSRPAQKSHRPGSVLMLLSAVPRSNLKKTKTRHGPRLAAYARSLQRPRGVGPPETCFPGHAPRPSTKSNRRRPRGVWPLRAAGSADFYAASQTRSTHQPRKEQAHVRDS